MSQAPLLSMGRISKRFPGVIALDNVELHVSKGEVVALCGENGAGKSTLMKILGGVYRCDEGTIQFDGQWANIAQTSDAIRLGIAFIHQEISVLDNLDVAANVFLGREPLKRPLKLIDRRKIHSDTEPYLKRLGLNVSSWMRLDQLSLAQQQLVEVARALSLEARLIIMDEPTSSLTLSESERLFKIIQELSQEGISIIYISHRLREVERCAHRVVVLRDGRNAGELTRDKISHDRIVDLMVGREIQNFYVQSQSRQPPGFFKVRNLRSSRFSSKFVSFDAGKGEILGFGGLVGAGRSEMAKAIVGLDPFATGEICLGDEVIPVGKPKKALNSGIYLVPEDRHAEGLVLEMTLRENMTLPSLKRYSPFHFIRRDWERKQAVEQINALRIKNADSETLVVNLSGGNQQKVVLGKWLGIVPKVLILDEPTRGIDVGAKAEIYRLMRSLAERGTVILMISSDMEELLHLSDRIAVMHEGEICGILQRSDCTEENIMHLATGNRAPRTSPQLNHSKDDASL
jgi:ribose transport system ATP-binding protein